MSDTGKQNPLGVNSLGSILQNVGFTINPTVTRYLGYSKTYTSYTPGLLVTDTCLRLLTYAINDGYTRGVMTATTYNNLISIGANSIPALGNSKPPTFTWEGPANTGNPTDEAAQEESWLPYDDTNPVTQWGYARLNALQAWNEFNWNGEPTASSVEYKDFCASYLTAYGYIEYSNVAVNALSSAPTFLKGTYSNMNDLISADITGVSLATPAFGRDLMALGKAIDFTTLASFGLPSNLLKTISKYNALTPSLSLALIGAELEPIEIDQILNTGTTPSVEQERKIYSAFLIIVGADLYDVLVPLNCKTEGLESLADLLNPLKMFPESYQSLTVPIYNSEPGPTNSKTYYPIYGVGSINPILSSPAITTQVGSQIPAGPPAVKSKKPALSRFGSPPQLQQIIDSDNVQFTTGGSEEATRKAIEDWQKFKSTPPGPGYVWDEGYGRWLPPNVVAFNNLPAAEQKEVMRNWMEVNTPGYDFYITNPGGEFQLADWAKKIGKI